MGRLKRVGAHEFPGVGVPPDPRPLGPLLSDNPYGNDLLKGGAVSCSGVMASRGHEPRERYGVKTVFSGQLKYYDPIREQRDWEHEE